MQKYINNVAIKNGARVLTPLVGGVVTVTTIDGVAAEIFDANGGLPRTSDLLTDINGAFSFYAADGRYTITITGAGIVPITISDVLLEDPTDGIGSLSGDDGADLIGNGGESVKGSLNALQLADYTALRAYTGPRKAVYVTGYLISASPTGIAGDFVRDDSDTTSTDNGGTIIVSSNGKRWKRAYTDEIYVDWFGALGNTVADDKPPIQAAIDYVHSLPEVPRKPLVRISARRYLILSGIQMRPNVSLCGMPRDIGYWFGFNHTSEIIAGTVMDKMIDVTGSNSYIGSLGLYGNGLADYGLYTAGAFGRTSSCTIEDVAVTLCQKTGIHLNNVGIVKIRRAQLSGCLECGLDASGFGDADIEGCYVNSMNVDSLSTVNSPSSATVYGVGMRFRKDPGTGGQCGNINIRGGKVEFCRVGMLFNSAQGVNITGVNFDTNRKASIYIDSDAVPLPVDQTAYSTSVSTSFQLVACRFLGGSLGNQGPSAHIIANYARYVTIVGNGFKRANDAAADFFGDISDWGPSYGIWLFNSERCTIGDNDLYGSAITNCLRIENVSPTTAQHTLGVNNMDGTEVITPGSIAANSMYANMSFASGTGPIANNTAKAWVRFNGSGAAPVIIAAHNVSSVNGAGGTYEVVGSVNWGSTAAVNVSARQWFGPSDAATYGAVGANTALVYSTTSGVLSSNGDITVTIYGL